LLARLANAYAESRLTVVLGAGISLEHGLPTWNELLLEVLATALAPASTCSSRLRSFCGLYGQLFSDSPLVAARQIKCLLGPTGQSPAFREAVKDILYAHEAFDAESPFYKSLANLCASPRVTKSVASVITYNFDNMLETYLDHLKVEIPYKTIAEAPHVTFDSSSLPIYHVHGFLPGHSHGSHAVTLSEEDYHDRYGDPLHWSNMVQLRAFSEDICIFLGLSMQDPNLRRLLDASNRLSTRQHSQRHAVVLKAPTPSDLTPKSHRLADSPLYSLLPKTEQGMDALLGNICELRTRAQTLEMQSLSCDILYVDAFAEIPKILDEIRQGGGDAD